MVVVSVAYHLRVGSLERLKAIAVTTFTIQCSTVHLNGCVCVCVCVVPNNHPDELDDGVGVEGREASG